MNKLIAMVASFHILVIATSNYLVQFPFEVFGYHTTWGSFIFPFIFLATDLTVRLFGAKMARQIILGVMFPALLISYIASSGGLGEFNSFAVRIALASFTAYMLGQFLDIQVFSRLRKMKQWWIAPASSTVVGNLLDTMLFFFIAFYASTNPFMAENWLSIAWVDYGFKLVVTMAVFLPMYGLLLKYLTNKLTINKHNNHP